MFAAIAGVSHTLLQSWTILSTGLGSLRVWFAHDQLGYLSMVSNVADGRINALEPDTETGSNTYPRAYYTAVGLVARTFDLHPVQAWNGTALTLQFAMVFVLGIAMAVISRRTWMALLAPLPFLVGNFAWVFFPGDWSIPLQSHAVLWGPFLALFSLNAEAAGLCIGGIVLAALAMAWLRPASPRARWITSAASAAAIGSLANFQTYSFLASIYAIGGILAAIEIHRRRSVPLLVATAVATILVFILGPAVSAATGQLPTLMFGLLPFVPGLLALAVTTRGRLALVGAIAVIFAAPQIVITMLGVAAGDPFLTFRTASNVDLGIIFWRTIAASGVAAVGLLAIAVYGLWRRQSALIGGGAGLAFTMILVSVNDLWGANAEPYRLWINTYLLALVAIALGLSRMLGRVPRLIRRSEAADGLRTHRRAVTVLAGVTLIAAGATAPDFWSYATDERLRAVWNPSTERERAQADLASAAQDREDALIAVDPCIDPRTTKVSSSARIAYYHLGMAWPDEYEAVAAIVQSRLDGQFDFEAAEQSGTGWILTDSSCVLDWAEEYADRLELVESRDYVLGPDDLADSLLDTKGTISLYRVLD